MRYYGHANVEIVHASGADIDLDFDQVGIDAIYSRTECFEEHRAREAAFPPRRTN